MRDLLRRLEESGNTDKSTKFAVTMSETGNAKIVTAKDHKDALKKVVPWQDRSWTGRSWSIAVAHRNLVEGLLQAHYGIVI